MPVITSQFYCLPPTRLTNEELRAEYGTQVDTICKYIGVEERRVGGDPLVLSYYAAKRIMPADGVDAIIFVSESFRYRIPCNAAILAHKLDVVPSICLDLSMGCSGFPYGLMVANNLIKSNPLIHKVLMVNCDVVTSLIEKDQSSVALRCLHGDAAAATLVERDGLGGKILDITLGTLPEAWSFITCSVGGPLRMMGAEVGHTVLKVVPKSLEKYAMDVYDTVLFHQANDTVTDMLYDRCGVSAAQQFKFIKNVGNLSNASTPVLMCEAMKANRINDVTRVLITSFGAGFSWGIVDLQYDGLRFPIGSHEVIDHAKRA